LKKSREYDFDLTWVQDHFKVTCEAYPGLSGNGRTLDQAIRQLVEKIDVSEGRMPSSSKVVYPPIVRLAREGNA
jgi:hypothetical protein